MNIKSILFGFIIILFTQTVNSQNNNLKDFEFPTYVGYVNDLEGIFTNEQIIELNEIIAQVENETSNEIAIVSISSYAPFNSLFEYSLDLANYWGIGKENKNNGIAIVFGKEIKQIRIQVGYGLENKLSDDEAKKIIDNIIIPEFIKGDFFNGIKKGLIEIINEIE
ncbi:MAG: TPM domain-containing protein [Urechidicola sp.]|nr:TPM domain-containing protein [Urechidicola sp.]